MSDIPSKTYPPSFVQAMIGDHEAEQAGATPEESSGGQAKEDAMSEIELFTPGSFGHMLWDKNGGWVRYQDHQAEVERLRAEVERLTAEIARITEDRDSWETEAGVNDALARGQLDAINLERQRDIARAEVERLTQELEGRRATNQRVIAERDAAQREVERLQIMLKCERDEVAQLRDRLRALRANGQGMLDSSRPSDETIWWKAFNSFLRDHSLTIEEVADQAQAALTIYRARWPR